MGWATVGRQEVYVTTPDMRLLLPLVLLGACADPSGIEWEQIALRTDHESYAVGDELVLTLENASGRAIQYSWCALGLQEHSADDWVYLFGDMSEWVDSARAPLYTTAIVLDECDGIPLPDGSAVSNLPLPVHPADEGRPYYQPGTEYRFVVALVGRDFEERAVAFSNSFLVAE